MGAAGLPRAEGRWGVMTATHSLIHFCGKSTYILIGEPVLFWLVSRVETGSHGCFMTAVPFQSL